MNENIGISGEFPGTGQMEIHQVRFMVTDLSSFLREIRLTGSSCGCSFIFFNRQVMAGRRHVTASVAHALRSFASGDPISRSIEVEALLYAAGTRQTGLIGPFGVHEGENDCYLCVVPVSAGAARRLNHLIQSADEEDWEIISDEKVEQLAALFGITREELEITGRDRIVDLVIERVALLVVNR